MKSLVGFKVPLQCSHTSSPPFFLATGTNTSDFGLKTQVVTVPDKLEHSLAFLITKPMSCKGILQWCNAIRTHAPHTQTSSLGAHQEWPPFFLRLCGVWSVETLMEDFHVSVCTTLHRAVCLGNPLLFFLAHQWKRQPPWSPHGGAWLCTQAPVRTGTCQGKT